MSDLISCTVFAAAWLVLIDGILTERARARR